MSYDYDELQRHIDDLEDENAALRAELSAIHATTEYQRWARAVTERDAAREAARRVEALLDEHTQDTGVSAFNDDSLCLSPRDVRAALAGPGEPTAVPPTLPMTPLTDEENRRILYAIDHSGVADTGPGATT